MVTTLATAKKPEPFSSAVDPVLEAGAYEALWIQEGMTEKKLADLFRNRSILPSEMAPRAEALRCAKLIRERLAHSGYFNFGIRLHRAGNYPELLRAADHPVELLYYAGDWGIVSAPAVSVVGTRNPSKAGLMRTEKLVRWLVENGFCVVSGLAAGIDTKAHESAIKYGGQTIGVIGTPLDRFYPKGNESLQNQISREFCLISQVPFLRYDQEHFKSHAHWFPRRNVTMASLTQATIIVEAGESSGTLTQARAALKQGKKVLILESNFKRAKLTWPANYEKKGAIRIRDEGDLAEHLSSTTDPSS